MKHLRSLPSRIKAFTLIELLVVISIIAVLASLALPAITGALVKGQITQTMSNYRQLYIVSQSAELDASSTGATNGGFPGDSAATPSLAAWSNVLVPAYLSAQSFANLYNVKGVAGNTAAWDGLPSSNSSGVMLSTANLSQSSGSNAQVQNVAPYNLKGGAVVNVSGQAVSVTGTNVTGVNNSMYFGKVVQ
jgi:prepilin-type N-terminal cleavage/methylation domain-containing protein